MTNLQLIKEVKSELIEGLAYAYIEGNTDIQFSAQLEAELINLTDSMTEVEIVALNSLTETDMTEVRIAVLEEALNYYQNNIDVDSLDFEDVNRDYHNVIIHVSPNQKVYEVYLTHLVTR